MIRNKYRYIILSLWLCIQATMHIQTAGEVHPIQGLAIIFGGSLYALIDYNVKKLEGASLKDAKIIAEEYNNDLMQKIFNEND